MWYFNLRTKKDIMRGDAQCFMEGFVSTSSSDTHHVELAVCNGIVSFFANFTPHVRQIYEKLQLAH